MAQDRSLRENEIEDFHANLAEISSNLHQLRLDKEKALEENIQHILKTFVSS